MTPTDSSASENPLLKTDAMGRIHVKPEQREAIHRIAADVFGGLWTGTAP